jgi:hypothetical protein
VSETDGAVVDGTVVVGGTVVAGGVLVLVLAGVLLGSEAMAVGDR